ncbi:MAG: hypothetical protein ACQEVD_02290 [Actinomycetota bacterium]
MSIAVSPILVEHSERLLLSAGSAPLHRLLRLDVQRELDVFVHESLHSFDDGIAKKIEVSSFQGSASHCRRPCGRAGNAAADEAASAELKSSASETTDSAVVVVPYSVVNLLPVSGAILDGIVPGRLHETPGWV